MNIKISRAPYKNEVIVTKSSNVHNVLFPGFHLKRFVWQQNICTKGENILIRKLRVAPRSPLGAKIIYKKYAKRGKK